jgi:predicted N-acetyltransferase YhbS
MADQPTIFTDGMPAPPVTSFTASKPFSRSIDAIKAHNMTLAGGASFNDGIFLAVVAVDRALKGSMVGERMNKSFEKAVREKEMSWGILKGENPFFSSEFYLSTI